MFVHPFLTMVGLEDNINNDWVAVIEKGDNQGKESGKRLKTLGRHFWLRRLTMGCYLFSHKVKLPEWGYGQQEVTCNKNAVRANSLWYIESAAEHLRCT